MPRPAALLVALAAAPALLTAGCGGRGRPAAAPAAPAAPAAERWTAGSRPGVWRQALYGDTKAAGLFAVRVRYADGAHFDVHTHANDLLVTMVRGRQHLALGAPGGPPPDSARGTTYGPGAFVLIPAGTPHTEWFSGDAVVQLSGMGPFRTTFVDTSAAARRPLRVSGKR